MREVTTYLKNRKRLLIGVGTTLLATLLLAWCLSKIDWSTFWLEIRELKLFWLAAGFAVSFAIIWVKALQIQVYLPKDKKISLRRVFQIVAILLMTVSTVPFWGGHALFVYLMGKQDNLGKTAALSIVTQDQVLDGFGKIFIILWAAMVMPLPDWMQQGVRGFILLVGLSYIIFFGIAFYFRNRAPETFGPARGFHKIKHFFLNWAFHLKAIRDPKKVIPVIFYASSMRVMEALAFYSVQKAFGMSLSFSTAVMAVAAVSVATTLPLSPGRLGVFEAAAYAVYVHLGVTPSTAMALALFNHMVHTLPYVITGYLVSLKTGFRRDQVRDLAVETSSLAAAKS